MRRVWQALKWTGAALIVCLALLWLGDYLSVRNRMGHKTATDPVQTITFQPVYAIARKDGKSEFDFGDPQNATCVHSIFPHLGYNPCWYVLRESQKPIPIGGVLIPLAGSPGDEARWARDATQLGDFLHELVGNIPYSAAPSQTIS